MSDPQGDPDLGELLAVGDFRVGVVSTRRSGDPPDGTAASLVVVAQVELVPLVEVPHPEIDDTPPEAAALAWLPQQALEFANELQAAARRAVRRS